MRVLQNIKANIHAVVALLVLMSTTTLCFFPILFAGLFKLIPNKALKDRATRFIDGVITLWCDCNNHYFDKIQKVNMNITGVEHLTQNDWHLVIANHQSWLDVVVLQRLFNRKIPVLKFFIKDQLKWVPLLGFAWWAMGCAFMKRYSKEYLAKNPHKKGRDLLSTQKAVQAFKRTPASIMNFVEGTRFTPLKKQHQNSPYTHLLKPKAGGISFIISTMGDKIHNLLDVTIIYPKNHYSLWDFLCKRIQHIDVNIRLIPIPERFISPKLVSDHEIMSDFKEWLNQKWEEKDNLIASII